MTAWRSGTAGAAGVPPPRRPLHFVSGGFLWDRRLRRILSLAGYDLRPGLPRPGGDMVVWGRRPVAARGERLAVARGARLLRVEDSFLRSLHPGRAGGPGGQTLGLLIDTEGGVHFDAGAPSTLERHLARAPLDSPELLARAEAGIARMRMAHLSKYCACDPAQEPPVDGYVLVIDQTRGDASIRYGGADAASFARMLSAARQDFPDRPILIKTHPETAHGLRPGYFGPADADDRTHLSSAPFSPWRLFERAHAVYAVSSLMGYEAILAGHRPVLFGLPFYAGWGLSEDRVAPPNRRGRQLSAAQLFAAAMLELPIWYDPLRDRLCDFETAAETLEAEARAWREGRHGHVATGMRLWKRGHLARFYGGAGRRLRFRDDPERAVALAATEGRGLLVWAGKEQRTLAPAAARAGVPLARVEDGFLRSRGLGAALVPPLSLVADRCGIYYDPGRESDLERLIAASPGLADWQIARARRLIDLLCESGVSKYNLGGDAARIPAGRPVVLVPGQVEDDASIRLGAGAVRTNLGLLQAARAARPGTCVIYKPHPDVEAGLRSGAVPGAGDLADIVLDGADPVALIAAADEVWTMTSLMGFEALIRGRAVVTLGAPFYAGWGLTEDHDSMPERRSAPRGRVTLEGLVHAALIGYPRYRDPVTGRPCTVELAVERLATGAVPRPGFGLRFLAKLQGLMASRADLWR